MQPLKIINQLLYSFDTSSQKQSNSDDDIKCINSDIISHYQQKTKQIQQNKEKITLKISQSNLNTEAINLLKEQASNLQYEQQLFDQLLSTLTHVITLNQTLTHENKQLKSQISSDQKSDTSKSISKSDKHNSDEYINQTSIHQQLLHLSQDKNSDTNPSDLLSKGANPNIIDPDYHKWTPLHYCVFLNKENFALQLLKSKNINAQALDSDGFSPLYWASKKSTPKVIKALLSHGCDPNQRDMHGMTPLFAAVASNKKENIEALLSCPNININQPNQFGGSVLHHTAFATDNIEIADLLVKAGGNLFLFDYDNKSPLHVAIERRKKNLFEYYKRKMEQVDANWKCDVSFEDNVDGIEVNGRWNFNW